MSWTQKAVRKLVENEYEKSKSFQAEYETPVYWLGIFMSGALGIIGLFVDFAVIYGIVYTTCLMVKPSFVIALMLSVLVAYSMSFGIFKATKSYGLSNYDKRGYSFMLRFCSFISVGALCASVYFSFNTDKIVKTTIEGYYATKIKDKKSIKDEYAALIQVENESYRKSEDMFSVQIKDLANDFVLDDGIKVPSSRSTRTKNKIINNDLPELKRTHSERVKELEQRMYNDIATLKEDNQKLEREKQEAIRAGAILTKGGNVMINIVRALLVCMLAVYVVNAIEIKESKKPKPPTDKKPKPTKKKTDKPKPELKEEKSLVDTIDDLMEDGSLLNSGRVVTMNKERKCLNPECGRSLEGERANKKTCSPKCRSRYNQLKKEIKTA